MKLLEEYLDLSLRHILIIVLLIAVLNSHATVVLRDVNHIVVSYIDSCNVDGERLDRLANARNASGIIVANAGDAWHLAKHDGMDIASVFRYGDQCRIYASFNSSLPAYYYTPAGNLIGPVDSDGVIPGSQWVTELPYFHTILMQLAMIFLFVFIIGLSPAVSCGVIGFYASMLVRERCDVGVWGSAKYGMILVLPAAFVLSYAMVDVHTALDVDRYMVLDNAAVRLQVAACNVFGLVGVAWATIVYRTGVVSGIASFYTKESNRYESPRPMR